MAVRQLPVCNQTDRVVELIKPATCRLCVHQDLTPAADRPEDRGEHQHHRTHHAGHQSVFASMRCRTGEVSWEKGGQRPGLDDEIDNADGDEHKSDYHQT
jgi:hypothetical protein